MPRIVLDAVAEAHLLDHLQIEHRPLLEPLRFQQLVLTPQLDQPVPQLLADGQDGALPALARGDVVGGGKDRHLLDRAQHLAAERIDLLDALHHVAEELDPDGALFLIGGKDLDGVALHPEGPAGEVVVVALVLDLDEVAQELVPRVLLAGLHGDLQLVVRLRRSQAVDAGHRGDDEDVVAREQRVRRRVTQPVDLVVDGGVFLDVRVGGGDVRLRLVIVVVADEELHRVLREQVLELAIKLAGERLVVSDHQRRLLHLRNDVGDGERLSRSRHPEQRLVLVAALDPGGQLGDGAGLVALRRIVAAELERHDARV